MLGDPVIRIQQVIKRPALTAVVALRAQLVFSALFAAQNQYAATTLLHHRQRLQGDYLVDLSCPGVGDRESAGVALLVFDHPKGRIANDHIHLSIWLVSQGIGLGELAKASGLEFVVAIWIQFIGDRLGWIGPN
jgi:ABC-type transporter Mla MlaB component